MMSSKTNLRAAWVFLLATAAAIFAVMVIPVWLIQPFAPQTERALEISYFLKTWSPLFTRTAVFISAALIIYISFNSKHWYGRAFTLLPFAVVLVCLWFAGQNHFEWMFNPLANTAFVSTSETDFVADDDMVMAVKIGGEAVAYPIRQMAYHHIVQDVVGGKPITATY